MNEDLQFIVDMAQFIAIVAIGIAQLMHSRRH